MIPKLEANLPLLSRREFCSGATVCGLGSTFMSLSASAATVLDLPVTPRELWPWVRAQLILDPAVIYLDTGAVGPGLRASLAAEFRHQELFNSDPENYQRTFMSPNALIASMKRFGALLGCDASEVALTHGASEALNIVGNGLQLNSGDEVIVTHHAHTSALRPWQLLAHRTGIVVRTLALPSPTPAGEVLGRLAAAVSDKTRVIAASHLQHTDGTILPIADICAFARQRNIFSVIDGAQACGAIGIDVKAMRCDFYAASLHKWMNAPMGHGLLYVRSELLEQLRPNAADSLEQANVEDRRDWPATARKFSNATRLIGPRLKGIEAALDFRDQLGNERIEARIRELAAYARLRLQPFNHIELLTSNDTGAWSGILSFKFVRGSSKTFVERIKRSDRIITSVVAWPTSTQSSSIEAVRICLHIYNSHEDVDRFVRFVQQAA